MKKKVLSLFSGIGAFEKALKNLGIEFDLVNYCEIDKYASKSYSLIHNVSEEKNLIDVTKVNTALLPNDLDLITYGFPCVPKGYMIKVENGYKAVEDITDNDLVLTHNNRYKRVVKTMSRVSDHINHIKLIGCQDLQLTDEHPLYVLRNGDFTWVKAKDLNKETDYLCYNINNKSIPCKYSDTVLWLIGRYFADGYKENHSLHRPIFCIGKKKIEEFETYIKPFKFSIAHDERPAAEYIITDAYLCEIFSSLTTGSTTKEIPQWIVDLPKHQLEAFYKGYFSGDGHSRKDRELYMFCTASKNMFLALQDIVIKLYNVVPTVSIRHDARKATYNDTYNVQYSYRPKDQIVKDNKVCVKIKDVIRELKDIEVFNFEVEEDNSYTVNNVIVHNCQDISQAGKQRGFEDENGKRTRSGLFFDALRIIEDTKPKYAIAENVKALTSKKFEKEFKIVLDSLDSAGYNNYYQVLNAKDYGVPQNRERIFIVSIRKDIDNDEFVFPEKEPLQIRLKDLLQQEVEEKYYLKESKAYFMKHSFEEELKGNGFRFSPHIKDNADIAKAITTRAGDRMDDNFIIDNKVDTDDTNFVFSSKNINLINDNTESKLEPLICASRGRNPDNPSDRREGVPTEQRLEINKHGISNTLTTVQKDNYVLEPTDRILQVGNIVDTGNFDNPQRGRIYSQEGISPALNTVGGGGQEPKITDTTNYRIRKLTPTECWRLMGFTDEDINKCIAGGLSNAQLYKQAGNSIVVQVLEKLLRALFDQTENEDLQSFINEVLY